MERLQKLAEELGKNAAYLKSDVTSLEDMKALVRLAKDTFGRIDVLFANAGIMSGSNMSELNKHAGLTSDVIANAVLYAVSQPAHVDVSDLVVRSDLEA